MDATGSATGVHDAAGVRRRPARTAVLVAVVATVVATTTATAALLLGGGAPAELPAGIADPGRAAGWALRGVRLAGLLAAIVAVGSVLVAVGPGPGGTSPARWEECRRSARRAAAAWALAALVGYVLVVGDVAGAAPTALDPTLLARGWTTPAAAAQLATAAVAAGVALASSASSSPARAPALLAACLLGALPVPVAGHAGTASDGGLALGGLVVHVGAALLWTGGLAGLLLHLRSDVEGLAAGARRFSRLALGAYVALVGSGLVAASAALPFRGEGWSGPWTSGYAAVLAAKVVAVGVLGAIGAAHRRRTLPRLRAGETGIFVRLASVELVLMAAAAGLATALARTPVPAPVGDVHAAAGVVGRPTATGLLTQWRPDALVLVVLAVAVGGYLRARRRVVARGDPWPAARTACFLGGIALAALALCSGVAVYAPLLLSVHLAQLVVVLLLVPALLVLGRPLTMARVAHGWSPPAYVGRVLDRPWSGAAAASLLLALVHRSPLTVWCLESPWWHLLTVVAALVAGLLLTCQLLGEGVGPQVSARSRGWLVVVAATLGVFALQLAPGGRLLAGDWFLELRLGWSEPRADQRLAGRLAGVVALALLVVAVLPRQSADRVPGSGQIDVSTRPSRSSAGTAP
ncbi:cytochrome c oxidase assembly protein [Nocardioides aequoreus]|uniref:cytochrome c oxidase assembly protein n=1 Tax=Nocardioides aequoreus TaxID=397278 RepID=UPI0004C40E3A|nr:cytochrome c oxidase assembly protein [Nocardioides aequoreus]